MAGRWKVEGKCPLTPRASNTHPGQRHACIHDCELVDDMEASLRLRQVVQLVGRGLVLDHLKGTDLQLVRDAAGAVGGAWRPAGEGRGVGRRGGGGDKLDK